MSKAATQDGLPIDSERRRGRGAVSNVTGRYERQSRIEADDGWSGQASMDAFATVVTSETARRIISSNDSPDISFDQSINPYRGCEHGCIYCYARPTHAFLGLSPGLDFETKIFAKVNAAELLENELAAPGYVPKTIALGAVTDPYQPAERRHQITRAILEVLSRANHPVGIVTKSTNVLRDIDILAPMASRGLVKVALSVTTLDPTLARIMEPRAATPARRIDAIRELASAGIPAVVMAAPIIPGLNDSEIEAILEAAKQAGAVQAGYVTLRLPLELKSLFREWLSQHVPGRADRVISLIQQMHGGRDYSASFGIRQTGTGPYATMIATRFRLAARRLGLSDRRTPLRTDLFRAPVLTGGQYALF
ncbi:MAG: PA0069 family radical SAM protein [Hyphomicrobiaceae bacterium]|nr:PA0069 family radical SAM protein [Hyphomicrobiaceae bacterium]